MPYEPHRQQLAIRRVLTRLAARRQFGGPVRDDGHDQTFRIVGEDEGDVPAISLVLSAVKQLGEMAVGDRRQNRRNR